MVRIKFTSKVTGPATSSSRIDDQTIHATLRELRRLGLTLIPSGTALQLIPDSHMWTNGTLYIVRLLARRNWTLRQALRDAEHIVYTVQDRHVHLHAPEVA